MLSVLGIVFPIYALIAVGFLLTRRGLFSTADIQALGRYVMNLALPGLMFTAIASRPLTETVQLPYVAIYGLGTLALMAALYPAYRNFARCDHKTAVLATMGSCCPNSGFVGYPILLLAMPGIASQTFAQNILVENVLFIPLSLTLLELGNGGEGSRWQVIRRIAWRILTGPLVLAMLAGVTAAALRIELPAALDRTLQMLAASSGAVSLIVIGGTLARLNPSGVGVLAGTIAAGKLILHPLVLLMAIAVANVTGLLDVPREMRAALILSGAVPTMGIFPVIAQTHRREGFASAALFGGTVASLFTLSALLLILR